MTINNSLKIKIIADFLSGIKREVIAEKYGISTGSVSAIAEEFEEEIPDIHKIRAMMIKLNATGNSAKIFYPSIRLHNYIKNLGLTGEQVELILEIFQEYAFKKNYNISELIDAVIQAFIIAQKCGTDLEHLKEYANERKVVLESMEVQIGKLRNDIEILPHKFNIALSDLQEYQRNKPDFQKFMNMMIELDIKDRRVKLLEDELKNQKSIVLKKDSEIVRLKQLLIQERRKKEGGYYVDYQEDIVNLDSTTDCLVDDDYDVDDSMDTS